MLFAAVGQVAGEQWVDELSDHLVGITEPSEWVVEALAAAFVAASAAAIPHAAPCVRRAEPFALSFTSRAATGTGRGAHER